MLDREVQSSDGRDPRMDKVRTPYPLEDPRGFVTQFIKFGVPIVSIIDHDDIANLISNVISVKLEANRVSVKLQKGDVLLVAQYIGPRLPEGATELPEDATLEWWTV